LNALELTGRARTHLGAVPGCDAALHVHAIVPFVNLRRAALAAGFALEAVSAFRDFDRQLALWNGKWSGARPLQDVAGRPLDASRLAPAERVSAILRWSALPGASRHHWGTDVDLIDANAIAPGYRVALEVEEYLPGGPFAPLAGWLEIHAARFGFFRPFRGVRSGVQAEPWHMSFAPVAECARRALEPDVLRAALATAPLLGMDEVMARLPALHARYVAAIDWP
jgi:LAS superfamily LD-carboxypeptidase LdcB